MTGILMFQLAGPLASWGEIAVGEDRQSATEPTRSAVLGLLAAALGIRRADDAAHRRLGRSCHIAIVTCDAGEFVRDFHTAQVPASAQAREWPLVTRRDEVEAIRWAQQTSGKAGAAILSFRDYRAGGRWIVAVTTTPEACWSLEELRSALLRPCFALYLGRKSCPPGLPLEPQVIAEPDLVRALARARFSSAEGLERSRCSLRRPVPWWTVRWEPEFPAGLDPRSSVQRRDDPVSRSRWLFRSRVEHVALLPEEARPCS